MTAIGYSSQDKAGRKGIETVCRVCQTNGTGPCGKEIIIGSVSVKHANTIPKRDGVGGPRRRCHSLRGPELSAATLALPKNVCNPSTDWGDPRRCSRLPYCQQRSKRRGRKPCEGGVGLRGCGGWYGQGLSGRWCPFLSPALWELPTIVRKLQLHFSDLLCSPVDSGYWLNGWTWKGYDPHLPHPCTPPPPHPGYSCCFFPLSLGCKNRNFKTVTRSCF